MLTPGVHRAAARLMFERTRAGPYHSHEVIICQRKRKNRHAGRKRNLAMLGVAHYYSRSASSAATPRWWQQLRRAPGLKSQKCVTAALSSGKAEQDSPKRTEPHRAQNALRAAPLWLPLAAYALSCGGSACAAALSSAGASPMLLSPSDTASSPTWSGARKAVQAHHAYSLFP